MVSGRGRMNSGHSEPSGCSAKRAGWPVGATSVSWWVCTVHGHTVSCTPLGESRRSGEQTRRPRSNGPPARCLDPSVKSNTVGRGPAGWSSRWAHAVTCQPSVDAGGPARHDLGEVLQRGGGPFAPAQGDRVGDLEAGGICGQPQQRADVGDCPLGARLDEQVVVELVDVAGEQGRLLLDSREQRVQEAFGVARPARPLADDGWQPVGEPPAHGWLQSRLRAAPEVATTLDSDRWVPAGPNRPVGTHRQFRLTAAPP